MNVSLLLNVSEVRQSPGHQIIPYSNDLKGLAKQVSIVNKKLALLRASQVAKAAQPAQTLPLKNREKKL